MLGWFRRDDSEVVFLRAQLAAALARIGELTDRLSPPLDVLQRAESAEPDTAPRMIDADDVDVGDLDVSPSLDVVVEELVERSLSPNVLRGELGKLIAYERTRGMSDAEIAEKIKRGKPETEDEAADAEFI